MSRIPVVVRTECDVAACTEMEMTVLHDAVPVGWTRRTADRNSGDGPAIEVDLCRTHTAAAGSHTPDLRGPIQIRIADDDSGLLVSQAVACGGCPWEARVPLPACATGDQRDAAVRSAWLAHLHTPPALSGGAREESEVRWPVS